MILGRVLKGVLRIRYLLVGGALGGGVTLQKVNLKYNKNTNKYPNVCF